MIYLDYSSPDTGPAIVDVDFVYTSTSDDTPFQLEIPAHNVGDAIFVWARGLSAPAICEIRDVSSTSLLTLTSIDQRTPSFGSGMHIMWGIAPAGAYQVYGGTGTSQIGIHIYRGVSSIGDTVIVSDVLDSAGADIPALSLENTDGTSRVWCGVSWNQLKASVSTPAGINLRLTSPDSLGGGTAIGCDSDGVSSFASAFVTATDAAFYYAWSVEMKT